MSLKLSRFEWGCLVVVALAFLVRAGFLLHPTIIWDSAWYLLLARSFSETGTFYLPWSEPGAPQYNGYWPPLFPIFVSGFVKVLGPSYETLVFASITASALLTAAVFFCTRDLFARPQAFAAAALVAANPAFYLSDAKGMSESLLALMVVLTVWAFVKSLDRPSYLFLALVFALLAYLGKASLGLPFVAAGIVALGAWRVWRRGWKRVLTSRVDLGVAGFALAAGAALALTRTGKVGSVGLGLIEPLKRAVVGAECRRVAEQLYLPPGSTDGIAATGPECWALLYPLKVLFVAAFLLVVTLPFSLRLMAALRAPRTERTDALWLATLLPLLAGAIFTSSFFFTERRNLVDFDNIRYLTPAMVPFLWLVLPHWRLEPTEPGIGSRALRTRHDVWFGLAVGSMFALMLLHPLAGVATLGRLKAFLWLSMVPLALALVAYSTQVNVAQRQVGRAVERRYIPAATKRPDWRILAAAIAILTFSAWFFSSWYVTIGLGLVVALTHATEKARVLAMALMLLASAAPGVHAGLPVQEASAALAKLPQGTVVAMSELIPFPAAVAPGHISIRLLADDATPPPEADVLLLQRPWGERSYEGFTPVANWSYGLELSPTLAARVWIEENVLGNTFEYPPVLGFAIYVRNGTDHGALYR